ncbi:hypothetical protein ACFLTD_05065 [Elusimicrobiota bacterium]
MKIRNVKVTACLVCMGILLSAVSGICGMPKDQGGGLDDKIFNKLHAVFENKDELAITENQLEDIKTLKIDTKKRHDKKEGRY